MGWSLLPNALRPYQIYCAPPDLGNTRWWMCQLNFAQRTSFSSGLRFFNEPEISVPPRGLVLRTFTSRKNSSTSVGFEPVNLGSRGEHVTPRPPRPTSYSIYKWSYRRISIWTHRTCWTPQWPRFHEHHNHWWRVLGCTGTTRNPSISLQWKSDESTKHYLTQMLLVNYWPNYMREKNHECVWRLNVASSKRTSLKSSRSDTFLTE